MTDPVLSLRLATEDDAGLLADLGRTAFVQAFGAQNTPENMALYLSTAFSPEIQAKELSNFGCIFIILYCYNQPGGYARLQSGSRKPCITGSKPIELVRFYLLQKWIGKGISGILMQACLEQARLGGHDVIWLSAWKENPRAIAFYKKWGFVEVGENVFVLGAESQQDAIMERKLK